MKNHLIEIEKQAFALKNEGNIAQAVTLFEQILMEEPQWEHGYGFFSLAECYEELGRYNEARIAYDKALRNSPKDQTIFGAYASFLYLHGDATDALNAHLNLLRLESSQGSATESTKMALYTLAERLGIPKPLIEEKIILAETHT